VSTQATSRGQWSSGFGFILAAAGSAIGLGNIWRFPYTAGENGGAAFVLLYLIFVVLIGIPVQLSELSMGRRTERNAVGAFKTLAPGTPWKMVGGLGVASGFGILSFYAVIAGWTLGYIYYAAVGRFTAGMTPGASEEIFTHLTGGVLGPILLLAAFMILTALVVQGGVQGGIERAAKILMPVFFVLLVALAMRSMTLPGAGEGLKFLFDVDFSKLLDAEVAGSALGQALFSLSLGMGAMITYGSYLKKDENMPLAAVSVAFFDTLIAILAGLIIFPALFSVGLEPAAGPGLVFVVMPQVLAAMPGGMFFAVLFYLLLAIAALTSTISLLEVIVSYFVDERGWSRPAAVWTISFICFVLGVPSALSFGGHGGLTHMLGGLGFLGLVDMVFGKYGLTIGALATCLFVGYRWGVKNALEEIGGGDHRLPGGALWGFLVRFLCPVAVLCILVLVVTGKANF
jgi:NSS family neurotransmitter:Na+ symporter